MITLKYIGNSDYLNNYSCNSDVSELCGWFKNQDIVQLDTETTVTKSIVDRELRVIQLGNLKGDEIFVIQVSFLSTEDRAKVLSLLADDRVLKIMHNAAFDYQVILKEGVIMNNVWDTMVMEKCLFAGNDQDLSYYALAAVLLRRYYIDVSKEQQSEFGDDIINDEKLVYAATDVVHLGRLYKDQRNELEIEDLLQLGVPGKPYIIDGKEIPAVTENEVVLAFSDIEYNGMGFDPEPWIANMDKAKPIVEKATKELNAVLSKEPYLTWCNELPVNAKLIDSGGVERKVDTKAIIPEDELTINWNSGQQVLAILKYVFPDIEKASAAELKKYLQENDPAAPKITDTGKPISPNSKAMLPYFSELANNNFSMIKLLILKKYDAFENIMKGNFRDRLIEDRFLLPKGSVMINWNSNPVKLEIFKWFNPNILNTGADAVEDSKHLHEFFLSWQDYSFANSLLTKYGKKFMEEQVDSDGRVRTRFDTILSTGRVSSSKPNMQNIPAMKLPEDRQNDYRNCFVPGYEGWSVVGSDYASQELAIIGTLSEDPVFLDALRTGKDLHSTCAELIYADKWKDAAAEVCGKYPKGKDGNPDTSYRCGYYKLDSNGNKLQGKCKCPEHKKLRNGVKTLNFGLAYGMSEMALSADLKITTAEAKTLMDDYFSAFPKIKGLLDAFGFFGTNHGFIRTPKPMSRKRYFPYWKGSNTSKFLMGKIERASKNMPIQGLAADMTKIALVLLRRKIDAAKVRDKVKLFMQVHDQLDSICINPFIKFWVPVVTETMELAARICLGNDLLKTDTETSEKWQK